MNDPKDWNRNDLNEHLQKAAEIEFWTIPLYLTSLTSIKGLSELKPSEYPLDAKLILSVVIQEMLHLELVMNLSNALGFTPVLGKPIYNVDKGIPFLHPEADHIPNEIKGYRAIPGPLSEETLKLFCAIELPAVASSKPWKEKAYYESIADLYAGLKEAVVHLWDTYYIGKEKNHFQKCSFNNYRTANHDELGFSQTVNSLDQALNVIEAIVEQGEGADAEGHVPLQYEPKANLSNYDPGFFKASWSHYHKFHFLLVHANSLSKTHELEPLNANTQLQSKLTSSFDKLILATNESFRKSGTEMTNEFWSEMDAVQKALFDLWKAGITPRW